MTILEKIKILEQYRGLTNRINNIEESIINLRLSALPSGIDYSKDKVQTSPIDQMPEYAAELSEMIELLEKKRKEFIKIKIMIEKAIINMENHDEANLLYMRYIQFKYWEDIAEELHVSEPTVYRLKSSALENIKLIVHDRD